MNKAKNFFEVLDMLRGSITGDFKKDLAKANKDGNTFSKELYDDAFQINEQP